jgi:8-oxo-dGTP diphosphatase
MRRRSLVWTRGSGEVAVSGTVRVTAALIEEGGRILLARRKPGKHMGGRWELPGGKIEPGESPEQSLARELAEELAIEVRVGEFLCGASFDGDAVRLELLVYRVERLAGEPQLLEHEEIRWVAPQDVKGYDLADSDRSAVERLFP